MKRSTNVAFFVSILLVFSMLAPTAAFAFADGKGHFKQGLKYEAAEEWDRAVEEFALAVTDSPKNPEYRLHLTRALFNASQMYIKKGTMAANEKDYAAAYTAFRRAYAFDPTNELAKSEMERMVRLQRDLVENSTEVKRDANGNPVKATFIKAAAEPQLPQKLEKLRDVPFPSGVDLQFIIKELARDLDLNVLFDTESFRTPGRKTSIDLKNVTAAFALDCIFLQEGLFFQKVGPRTVMVANQAQRVKFQQLVLRTFYLANAKPSEVAKIVQTAIPAQPGRSQTIVLIDEPTNSITIRDTAENIRLIGRLIQSLDKDRAEVVMDVAIYEVNKSDLLQIGNQIGTQNQLTNLGGSQPGVVRIGPRDPVGSILSGASTIINPTSIPTGILLPSASLSAFQSKNDTKLLASTQIHAFNNEDSSARIGQRVPVQSAQFVTGAGTTNNGGVVSNVINYEQVGLTLKFKPLVFPNQDVQVAMEIESKDVAGASTLTPTFTERTIKGTARIQNNKTLLLASVAQNSEAKGKAGLPLLGLIPIIGRLFTAPTRDNRQVDIVIAVTPRVIRAPAILPEDEVERDTGSLATPTNSSLEALVIEEDRQEQERLALTTKRNTPASADVQLPDRPADTPEYVKTDAPQTTAPATTTNTVAVDNSKPATTNGTNTVAVVETSASTTSTPLLKPIDTGVKTLQLDQTSNTTGLTVIPTDSSIDASKAIAGPTVDIRFGSTLPEMKVGDKIKLPVVIDGSGKFRSAVIGLKFDPSKVVVRSVAYGEIFGKDSANTAATPFLNQNGRMYISLTGKDGSAEMDAFGVLAYIEIEAIVAGTPEISFDRDVLNFVTAEGKTFALKMD